MSELDYDAAVKNMTDKKLVEWTSGNKPGSHPHMVGMLELEKRKSRWVGVRSWIALGISAAALFLSALSYLKR